MSSKSQKIKIFWYSLDVFQKAFDNIDLNSDFSIRWISFQMNGLQIYLFIHLFIYLFTYLFIYLFKTNATN